MTFEEEAKGFSAAVSETWVDGLLALANQRRTRLIWKCGVRVTGYVRRHLDGAGNTKENEERMEDD